jgi:hypothetical protein
MPIVARPWIESLSPRSVKVFKTIAVLLKAKRNPQNNPSRQDKPMNIAPRQAINSTPPIWTGAPKNMRLRMESNCGTENSMPMVKSSSTIPTSAKLRPCRHPQ